MFESIKKSFRSILGSSTAPGMQEDVDENAPSSLIMLGYDASATNAATKDVIQEESKQTKVVVVDDFQTTT